MIYSAKRINGEGMTIHEVLWRVLEQLWRTVILRSSSYEEDNLHGRSVGVKGCGFMKN